MDSEQLQRYNRQIILPDVGREGQQRLLNSRVLCVGAGGLGSPATLYLAAAGVGTLGLIDADQVDTSNLQRQILFQTADQGRPKVEAARERLRALNPELTLNTYAERLHGGNAEAILAGYDLVLDGSDNFATKFLVNDCAVKLGIPMVYGSILGFDGQAAVFWARHGACYRCMYPEPPKGYIPNCAEAGVIGAVAGMIGSLQALETIKLLLAGPDLNHPRLRPLVGRLWLVSTLDLQQTLIDIPRNPACPVCSLPPASIQLQETAAAACTLSDLPSLVESELAEHPGALLIDVRAPAEFAEGHLRGAINIPLEALASHPRLLAPGATDQGCILYCRTGARSAQVAQLLIDQGIPQVFNLKGGILLCTAPLEKDQTKE